MPVAPGICVPEFRLGDIVVDGLVAGGLVGGEAAVGGLVAAELWA
jgi:hypothetical protein